ncbi:MAG: O-antigen ligase family protein [bacterium]
MEIQKNVQLNNRYKILTYLKTIVKYLLILYIFLLPIQTRFIYYQAMLNNGEWEYGTKSLYATEILLLIIILLYIIGAVKKIFESEVPKPRFLQTAKGNLKNPLISLPIALLFWSAFSILWSYDKSLAWYRWTVLLEGIILYLILISNFQFLISNHPALNEGQNHDAQNYKKNKFSSAVIIALIAGVALQSLLAIYQFATQQVIANKWLGMAGHIPETLGSSVVETSLRRWLRSYGSLPHPNILAAYLGIGFLIFLFFYSKNSNNPEKESAPKDEFKKRGIKILKTFAVLILAIAILFTFSRAAWLGIIFAGIIFIFSNRKRFFDLSPTNIGFAIFFIFLIFLFREPIHTRLKGENRLEKKSNHEHILSYKEGFEIIKANPFLGIGIGNYTLVLYNKNSTLPSYSYQPSHNFFMLLWAELGIIGLVTFIIFLFAIIKRIFMSRFNATLLKQRCDKDRNETMDKESEDPYPRRQIALLVFLLILMLFDHYFWSLYFGVILWWITIGILISPIRDL